MNGKVVCIVQARTGSSRLPGKVLKNISGKPMLEHVIERLRSCKNIDKLIVATSVKQNDNVIENLCKKIKVKCFRGSESNVLSRYYFCAKENNADIVVRVTSDCPLISPNLVDDVIQFFQQNNYDYVSPRSKDGLIRGLDVEVFSMGALEKTFIDCKDKNGIEHVTYHMYSNENDFKIKGFSIPREYKIPKIRLCVDEEKDFEKISKIYNVFYKGKILDVDTVIQYLINNPNINEINKDVKQKNI